MACRPGKARWREGVLAGMNGQNVGDVGCGVFSVPFDWAFWFTDMEQSLAMLESGEWRMADGHAGESSRHWHTELHHTAE